MANKRLFQLFAKRETLPGTLATSLVATANGTLRIKDPQMTPNVQQYDREILYGSLSALQTLAGKAEITTSFAVELAGNATGTAVPIWSECLEACGMRKAAISGGSWSGIMTGTATGTAKVAKSGDLWTNTGGTKVIRIFHDTYESASAVADSRTLFYEIVTGSLVSNDAFFPVGSDATVGPVITLTGGQPNNARGFGWYPISTPVLTIDIASIAGTHTASDIYKGNTSGAIIQSTPGTTVSATTAVPFRLLDGIPASGGEVFTSLTNGSNTATATTPAYNQLELPTMSFALVQDGRIITTIGNRGSCKVVCELGKPVFLEFTFKGVFSSASSAGVLSGITYNSKVPPRFMGVGIGLVSYVSGEPGYFSYPTMHTPRLQSISFDLGTEPNLQDDATSATGTGPYAHITGTRKAQGSVKVDTRPEGSWPLINKFLKSETFGLRMRIADPAGTAAQLNNTFILSSPGNKTTGVNPTDTNNFAQDDVNFSMSSANPDGSDGDQREMILTYHFVPTGTA